MDIQNINKIENATSFGQKDIIKIGIVLAFFIVIAGIAITFGYPVSSPIVLIFAAVVGGYMALNIGANDVANNVGPAVGSHAITLVGAIIIAAIAEALGAIISLEKMSLIRLNLALLILLVCKIVKPLFM